MNLLDTDQVLQALVRRRIEAVKRRQPGDRWKPGAKLKLLLAGYNGTRNTGGDVRVAEMIRQFQHLLGEAHSQITITTIDPTLSRGYFPGAEQVVLPQIFPPFLESECPKHHGVVACEGSMFKSKWANALTTMMAGALGMANAEGKLSVGYGAEAGEMSPPMTEFVRRHCKESFVLCRNEPSRQILKELGIRSTGGTDTAWTFEPAPPAQGEQVLRRLGWDGETPVLAVCPINPFWWPVKFSIGKLIGRRTLGLYKESHYKSVYFHHDSPEARYKYAAYLNGLAEAVDAFTSESPAFVILVGMEKLDRRAAEQLVPRLHKPAPVVVSDQHDMYEIVSILRRCAYLVSSRYHAIVTSMPGAVASAGVTMDERIRNLMTDRGHQHLMLEVDDPQLGPRLLQILRRLKTERQALQAEILRALPRQYQLMGQMGIDFLDELARVYPDFDLPQRTHSWESHLPPLSPEIRALLEQHA